MVIGGSGDWRAGGTRACSGWKEEAMVENEAEAMSVVSSLQADFWSTFEIILLGSVARLIIE